jgi:hypothetical protein
MLAPGGDAVEQDLDVKTKRVYYRIAVVSFVVAFAIIGLAWAFPTWENVLSLIAAVFGAVGVAFRVADRLNIRVLIKSGRGS